MLPAKADATASIVAASPSMPVFTASAPGSAKAISICRATKPGGTEWMACTPRVSWAVSAVIAVLA